ncbi:MAG: short-chain dehydrogenase, partial [Anaerolineaceae bacterium 4572_5.1]
MTIQKKFDLTGKTAIVTGGSGLLGAEFSRTLAEAGANVVVADIAEDAAQKTASGLADAGFHAASFGLDVTRPESAAAMVAETLSQFGSLDIL